jgi:monoamine oxidase
MFMSVPERRVRWRRLHAAVTALARATDAATVTLADGKQRRARRIVCTVPLTVLRGLKIDPPLPSLQDEAARAIPHGSATSFFFSMSRAVLGAGRAATRSMGLRGFRVRVRAPYRVPALPVVLQARRGRGVGTPDGRHRAAGHCDP